MLIIYSDRPAYLGIVRTAMPGAGDVILTTEWRLLQESVAQASCVVAVIEDLRRGRAFARLCALKRRFPLVPTVLVTRPVAENMYALKDIIVEELVWIEDCGSRLSHAIRLAESRSVLNQAAEAIRTNSKLPSSLRMALTLACERPTPFRSLAELSAATGMDRRTIWRTWRKAVGGVSIMHFLWWVVLLHAISRRSSHRSWIGVCQEIGISVATLRRIGKRLLGVPLEDLGQMGDSGVAELFRARLLARILNNPALAR